MNLDDLGVHVKKPPDRWGAQASDGLWMVLRLLTGYIVLTGYLCS